jgi:hypothetical protein
VLDGVVVDIEGIWAVSDAAGEPFVANGGSAMVEEDLSILSKVQAERLRCIPAR